ncbi:MAG: PAS domain S-box protein [Cyclobacteriaceae bacterium]
MKINFIDAKEKSPEQIREEVDNNSLYACAVYNIGLQKLKSLANQLGENAQRKIHSQFSTTTPKPEDIFLIDENHEIAFNGSQIDQKGKPKKETSYDFRSIIESSLNEVYVFNNTDYTFEFVNQGALKNLGYTMGEMSQLRAVDIKPNISLKEFEVLLEPLISGKKKNIIFETVHQRADKSLYDVEVHLQMMEQEGLTFFVAVIIDITDWKEVNKHLSDKQEKMSLLAQNYPDGSVSLIDKELNILFTDGEGYRKHGVNPEPLVGLPAKQILTAPIYQELEKAVQNLPTFNKSVYEVSFEGRAYQNTLKAIFDDDGQFKYFVLRVYDITELREKTKEIEIEKNKYVSILNALNKSALVSISDSEGIILQANEEFCKISKYEESELIGQNHNIVNSGYHPKAFWTDMWEKVLSGKVWRAEVKDKAKDGSFYWADTVVIPIMDIEGKITSLLSTRYLITDKKELALAKDALTERLSLATKAAKMGVWSFDVQSQKVFWDDKTKEIYRVKEFDGQLETFIKLFHEDDRAQELESIFGYIEDPNILEYDTDCRLNTSNNEDVYVKGKAIIERENGIAKKITGVVYDVTEEKIAEQRLKEKNNQLALLESFIDQSTDALQVSNETGRLVYVNKTAALRLAIDKQEASNYYVGEFEPLFKQKQAWQDHIQDLKTKGTLTIDSINFNTETKKSFPVEVTVSYQVINGNGYVIANSRDITERKLSELALLESEKKFRFIAENTSDGIMVFENDHITYSSDAYNTILGYSQEECETHNREFIYNSLHPEDRESTFKLLEESIKNLASGITYQFRVKHKKGHYIWREDRSNLFYDERGNHIKSIVLARDITQRKQNEIALQESEAKHRFLVENSQELICIHEPTGLYKFISPSIFKLTGYTTEELIGKDPYDFFHPDDVSRILENHQSSQSGGASRDIQYRFRKKDNTYIWLVTYTSLIKDNDGNPISLITGSRDITEIKEAELKTKESEERFKAIANNLPGVVYQCRNDENFSMIYLNNQIETLTGVLKETFISGELSIIDLVHEEDRERVIAAAADALKNRAPFNLTYKLFNTNKDEWNWVEEFGQGVFEGSELRYIEGVVLNINQNKLTALALQESEEMLSSIADNIPGAIWRYKRYPNGEDKIDYISKGIENIWELSREEVSKNTNALFEMIHPDDISGFMDSIEESSKNLTPWKYEYRIIISNGKMKWLSAAGQPKQLDNGTIVWNSLALDVTDRKEAEIALEKTLKQLNLSIRTGKLGIWESGIVSRDLIWNDQMFDVFGIDKSTFDYKLDTFNKMLHPEDAEYASQEMSRIALGEVVQDVRFRVIRPDGKVKHIYASGAPILNDKGEVEKLLGVNIDVTHIAEYQAQLEAALDDKEALFKELHHRIKNNLQMVTSLLHIKSTMTKDFYLKSFVNETTAKILSISAIHEQLLQMQGVKELDIKDYLESLCKNLVRTYSYGNLQFELETQIASITLDIDRVLSIGLIVNEIISNTMKYAYPETGSGKIYVFLRNENNESILTVSDDGIGIPTGKTTNMSGSYGMQLISLFTQQIDGTLEIQNTHGTKFIIKFPTNV